MTVYGLSVSVLNASAFTVNRAVLVTVPSVAEMVEVVDCVRNFVATRNVAVLAPAGTVTVPGTVAAAVLLLARAMVVSTAARPPRVTVPLRRVRQPQWLDSAIRLTAAAEFTVRVAVLMTVPSEALRTTAVWAATGTVVIVNVALVLPDATVTLGGTDATAGLALVRATVMPPMGALPVSVTVPVELDPPVTVVGLRVRVESAGGFTVRVAVLLIPPAEAVITTGVWAATGVVRMVNVAVLLPDATVTLAGTVAMAGFALERVTKTPPAGAAAVSVTVPVEVLPPIREVGLNARVERAVIVSTADEFTPPYVADIVTEVSPVAATVETVKVAVLTPAPTTTLAGTVAAFVLLLDSETRAPPAGAGPLKVKVAVEVLPAITVVGFKTREDGLGGLTVSVAEALAPYVAVMLTPVDALTA